MAELIAENICLEYPIFGMTGRSLKKSLLRVTTGGLVSTSAQTLVVQALNNVSFHLKDSDKLALIGHNGAGKSTLLRVLAGIYAPNAGQVLTKGSVATLLDISLGMQPEATGYENIYIRGLLMGLTREESDKLIPDIEEFTQLGEFLSMPIKTYSTGMRVRLAFALSTATAPEILLLDEAIGAGDASFIEKAQIRLKKFINRAQIMVLASHDNNFVKEFCNKALWLEHGTIKGYGNTTEILTAYTKSLNSEKNN